MAELTIVQIIDKLSERLETHKAEELLALALEQLGMPVQERYTTSQVVAIGAAIADAQRAILAGSEIEAVRNLESTVGPFLDGIKKDAPHQG